MFVVVLVLTKTLHAGSGFKSKHAYRNGYFSTRVKLPAGYTAGTNTAFYVSNADTDTWVLALGSIWGLG